MPRNSPSGSLPELPPDLPPEYAEAYLSGFRRAYDEARATLAAGEPADPSRAADDPEPPQAHPEHEDTEAVADDDTRTFERVEPWTFEPPETEQEGPEPEWAFEPPERSPEQEPSPPDLGWEFEAPAPGGDHPDPGGSDEGERAPERVPEDRDWVVPGFAVRDDAHATGVGPFTSREASPQWIALAVLVCVAAVVLALLLVVIF